LNYRRCLRILGQWTVPNRSSEIDDRLNKDDHFADLFLNCLNDPNLNPQLIASLQQLKDIRTNNPSVTVKWKGGLLVEGSSSDVMFEEDSNGSLRVIKAAVDFEGNELIRKEIAVLKTLNHPLTLRLIPFVPEHINRTPAIMTEFMGNGSLANHLSGSKGAGRSLGPTRIAKIVSGIVLGMRYIHSRNIIHRDLTPDNILLDWNWTVRISNFGHSRFTNEPSIEFNSLMKQQSHSGDFQYLTPEHFDGEIVSESDVFSFGLILYELIVGKPAFPRSMGENGVAKALILGVWKPNIPKSVLPDMEKLICDCVEMDYEERPSFDEIFERLKKMRFKLMEGVDIWKVARFVERIENQEKVIYPQ
jgi:serine/threonine protein kinase